jgi:hypothetical protein
MLDGMVTVTVELVDEVYARLKRRADSIHESVEFVVAAIATHQPENIAGDDVTPEFMALVRRQIEQYGPVFKRLADS